MSAAAGFHSNDASWKLAKEYQNLRPSQFLAQHCTTCAVSSVNMKHIFRQIESDCDNPQHDRSPLWIIADPPWHVDAIGGGYIINAQQQPFHLTGRQFIPLDQSL